jgi:hypothetical protein
MRWTLFVTRGARFGALCCWASLLAAQGSGTVQGRVLDSLSRQPLAGITVRVTGASRATRSDVAGRFTIAGIDAGTHAIDATSPGFRAKSATVVVAAGGTSEVEILLARSIAILDAAVSTATVPEREAFLARPNVGATTLGVRTMGAVPRLGEADPVRVVQLLPGVLAKNDLSAGMNVRGGEADQNLVLLDGHPIYNPFHLGGMLSTFTDEMVQEVALRTGPFPSRYGGRLSGLLDVRSIAEHRTGVHGAIDVSVIAASATLAGATQGGSGSWAFSARRTYADQVAAALGDIQVPYHFGDLQARFTRALGDRTRIALTAYNGRDVLDGSFAEYSEDGGGNTAEGGAFHHSWGNSLIGGTATTRLGADSLLFEQRVSLSRFHSLLDLGSGSSRTKNRVGDLRVGGMLMSYGERHEPGAGYEIAWHDVGYAIEEGQGSINTTSERDRPVAFAMFVEDLWRASPKLLVEGGLRFESIAATNWSGLSPRLSVKRFVSPDAAVTLAVGRHVQWMHSLALEDDPVRLFDTWRVSGAGDPVATSWQGVTGYERWFDTRHFVRAEGFYKRYFSLLEPDLAANTATRADAVAAADGTSWGGDLLLRRAGEGAFNGWLAYTYAVSKRWQGGTTYWAAQDRRHDLNLVATYKLAGFVAGARAGYGSAMPYTDIVAAIPRRFWDPVTGTWGGGAQRAGMEAMGATRNGARLPPTRRLDLYLERAFTIRNAEITVHGSVINATNAQNVLYYTYDYSSAPGKRSGVSQLPIIPTLGFSVAF